MPALKSRISFSVIALVVQMVVTPARSQRLPSGGVANITVDAGHPVGTVWDGFFGQNIEYEHGAISGGEQNQDNAHGLHTGGLWAEMLRDRKFEEGDVDQDGVANAWVPEERITNRYAELIEGRGADHSYRIDHQTFYGGGAAQAIDLNANSKASIYQVSLHFTKGNKYSFYVYLKSSAAARAWVEFSGASNASYTRHDFSNLTGDWAKYSAEFIAPETTDNGKISIGGQGNGTLWIDSASLMPADNFHGMRMDVIQAAKPLRVPVLRYPGGCFADNYHWKDGIGDLDKRPERFSIFWNEWEPNDFGFNEFMLFAKELGFESQITTNSLSGTAQEAAQWVQYSNGAADSPMGKLRAANGHAEPYGIRLWAVGNEVQELCSGAYFPHNDVAKYARQYQAYRDAIHKEDPRTEVVAVGAGPGPLKWNDDFLSLVPDPPFLGISIYTGEGQRRDDFDTKIMDLDHFYQHVVAEPLDFDRQLTAVIKSIGTHMPAHRPLIAVTEFQAWWLTEKVDEDLRLCDALYLAGVYHSLFRHSDQVGIAQIESLLNVQGVIEASQTSVKLTPEYFASLLYREHTGKSVLSTTTSAPPTSFNSKLPVLDAIATLSEDKHTLYAAVINRAESEEIAATIQIQGWQAKPVSIAKVYELNGDSKVAANPFGSSSNVNIREKSLKPEGPSVAYKFPAHSVTIIEILGQ